MSATRPSVRATMPAVAELVPAPDVFAVARKLAALPHLCLFDSAERHAERGRYSFVMAGPSRWFAGTFAELERSALAEPPRATLAGLPPFQGGVAGLFGYNLADEWEPSPAALHDDLPTPRLAVGRYDSVVSFDHAANRAWALAPTRRQLARLLDLLNAEPGPPFPADHAPPPADPAPRFAVEGHPGLWSNFSRAGYLDAVRRAVEYVHAGDCFQVNLSRRLLAELGGEHPLTLYERLRRVNPAPFGGYLDIGGTQIASASPERFLHVTPPGEVVTRPIKGTRPRGATPKDDARLAADLLANPKDRAENVMIVDLLRNDIGRVAAFGSVRVPAVCELETFRTVHHLVSEVRGRLAPGKTVWDLLRAALPGGSVTGAPKVRAIQIIAELEPTARGAYCGGLGYVGFDGAADSNVLIRSFTAARGLLAFPVGGGVVADSDPEHEYEETLHKAAGLIRALPP